MRIVGIDPSLRTGVCIADYVNGIRYCVVTSVSPDGDLPVTARMRLILNFIEPLISEADAVCVEDVSVVKPTGFQANNFVTPWLFGDVLQQCYKQNIKCYRIVPSEHKKRLTGNGKAKKDSMIIHANAQLAAFRISCENDNEADAYSLVHFAIGELENGRFYHPRFTATTRIND